MATNATISSSSSPSPTPANSANQLQISTFSASSPIIPLTIPISTKLNSTNFLTWKSQILPIIHGYKLTDFITAQPPSQTVKDANGKLSLNPDYQSWHCQDQLILGWILSSLTEPIQAQVVSCSTSCDLWASLQASFSATSRARLSDLRRQLLTTTKGAASSLEYLQKMRRIADELTFIGSPPTEEDLTISILNGLGSEFSSFVAAINTSARNNPVSFADLQGLLLSHEAFLLSQTPSPSLPSLSNPSALHSRSSQRPSFRPKNRSFQHSNQSNRPLLPTPRQQPSHLIPRPNHYSQARASPINSSNQSEPKQVCQICSKVGHLAKFCWFRFDHDPDYQPRPSSHQAYTAHAANATSASDWILDSGATHHVTSDLNNLSTFYNYEGQDALQIGSGMELPIKNIGYPHQDCGPSSHKA